MWPIMYLALHMTATGPMAIFAPIFGSEDRRWGVLRSSGSKNEDRGGSSIFGAEYRRSKIEEPPHLRSSIFGPEEWVEDRKEDEGGRDFFED